MASTVRSTHSTLLTSLVGMALAGTVVACGDDDSGDTPGPGGEMPEPRTSLRAGTLEADGPGGAPDATGMISIEEDSSGSLFVVLGADFSQEMGPGDTQIIFAQTGENVQAQRDADPDSASPSVGTIANGFSGEATFPVPDSVDPLAFEYVIVWCPTAGVNFGAARLGMGAGDEVVRSSALVADGPGGAPDATGSVSVVRSGDRLSILLGDDFMQEMGPGDTQLLLARSADNAQSQRDADPASVSSSLGTIPNGATGSRTFEIPEDVDLDAFDYVIVWCPTAAVNFGAAELPLRSTTLVGDGAGGAPDASGAASFARMPDGSLTLELGTDFMQEMGPGDTQVFLTRGPGSVADQRSMDEASVSAPLGTIANGATGAQSFVVPAEISVDQFDYVIVWCPTAEVNFGVGRMN